MLVSLHLICLDDIVIEQAMGVGGGQDIEQGGQDIEQAMGVGGGAGYRAGNGGRWGGGQDIEQAMGVGGGAGYRAGGRISSRQWG